jgi:hypothetical protein
MKDHNITLASEPEYIEKLYRGKVEGHHFWLKVDNTGRVSLDWFYPRSVPYYLVHNRDNVAEHCKRLLGLPQDNPNQLKLELQS